MLEDAVVTGLCVVAGVREFAVGGPFDNLWMSVVVVVKEAVLSQAITSGLAEENNMFEHQDPYYVNKTLQMGAKDAHAHKRTSTSVPSMPYLYWNP